MLSEVPADAPVPSHSVWNPTLITVLGLQAAIALWVMTSPWMAFPLIGCLPLVALGVTLGGALYNSRRLRQWRAQQVAATSAPAALTS